MRISTNGPWLAWPAAAIETARDDGRLGDQPDRPCRRCAGGERRSPLPDFYIGAHAAVAGMGLLTRNATRYRTYFPKLELIAP